MPRVSVIVPCYNEEVTIRSLLDAIYHQTYPHELMEVVIADGMSTDQTRHQISIFQSDHPDIAIRVIDNTARSIPVGLNLAIEAAQGEYIIRLDAHSKPYPDYIAHSINNLENGLGDNVGGVWEIQPGGEGFIAKSITLAASHPFGVGDARYRYTDKAGLVDTVPFGAFKRTLFEKIGKFNEELLTNEDYELNYRIRQSGGKIWLDPAIRSIYYARPTLLSLARQYWRYGYWKAKMLRKYPGTIRLRQALPPAFVASLVFFSILSIWRPFLLWLLLFEVLFYAGVLMTISIRMAIQHKNARVVIGVPLAMSTMHICWGSAFLWSLVR